MVRLYSGDPPDDALDYCTYMKLCIENGPENVALLGRRDVVAVPVTADYDDAFQKIEEKDAVPVTADNLMHFKPSSPRESKQSIQSEGKARFWVLHAAAINIGENERAEDFEEYTFGNSPMQDDLDGSGQSKGFVSACLGFEGEQRPRFTKNQRRIARQLDAKRYKRDMGELWNVAFQAAVQLRVQHLIVFPFGMGAFLRNLHKCDPQYSDEGKIRGVRRYVADGLAEAVANVAVPASLKVHLCLVHGSPEGRSNHNVLIEALGEKARTYPNIRSLLQVHRNLDALKLATQLCDLCKPSRDGVHPVAMLNGANKKLLGNHWFSYGARFAIDENLHRRSASMALASLLLNGGAQPRHREVHELHDTVRFLGGKVINTSCK